MALTALLQGVKKRTGVTVGLITLGVLGASLFFGDSMITPAISVLSAVEGLKVAVPSLASLVLPIAVAVLAVLFAIQRFGTGLVGEAVRSRDGRLVHRSGGDRHPRDHPRSGGPARRSRRATRPCSSSTTGRSPSWRSAGSYWP